MVKHVRVKYVWIRHSENTNVILVYSWVQVFCCCLMRFKSPVHIEDGREISRIPKEAIDFVQYRVGQDIKRKNPETITTYSRSHKPFSVLLIIIVVKSSEIIYIEQYNSIYMYTYRRSTLAVPPGRTRRRTPGS